MPPPAPKASAPFIRHPLLALVLLASLTRLLYLAFTDHVYGDGVQYADIARRIADGLPITPGLRTWMQGFSLWEAPFHFIFSNHLTAAAAASLIPGILLVIPAYSLGNLLYGRSTALIAAAIVALHPFLIHYSANGYLESLYLLFFTTGIAALTKYLLRPSFAAMALFGTAFGLALTVRNEIAPVFLAGLAISILTSLFPPLRKKAQPVNPASLASHLALSLASFTAIVISFGSLSQLLTGTSGLFTKTENFSRVYDIYSERLDAAKELLGPGGHSNTPEEAPLDLAVVLDSLASRFPKNILPLAKAIPPLLANPIYLFSLATLVLWWRRGHPISPAHLPSLVMLTFAPAFYVLFFVEPRYLIPSLIPLTIYTAEGLRLTFASSHAPSATRRFALAATASLSILIFFTATAIRGHRLRLDSQFHQATAAAFSKLIPTNETIVGCGFGYITDTAFRSGHPTARRLVTDIPSDLAPYVQKNGSRWLVLYEEFLTGANPALLANLSSGIPGFTEVSRIHTSPGRSAHIYRLHTHPPDPNESRLPAPPHASLALPAPPIHHLP